MYIFLLDLNVCFICYAFGLMEIQECMLKGRKSHCYINKLYFDALELDHKLKI